MNINSRLRHALLDTRKKLASLSATATLLAEQIKVALDDDGRLSNISWVRTSLTLVDDAGQDSDDVANRPDVYDDQAIHLWRDNERPCIQSPPTSSAESISRGQEPEPFQSAELELIIPSTSGDAKSTYASSTHGQTDRILVSMDAMLNGCKDSEAMLDLVPRPHLGPKLNIYSKSIFSEHLDHIHGLLRLGGALENGPRSAIHRSTLLEDLEFLMPCSMPRIVERMMSAFLEYGWPSLKVWFDVTQSTSLGARVIWWQTSNSHEAATQVPPQNTPTLVQLSQLNYPCILDWVPHPGLRDLLILNYQYYNVDQVICDMTNAFVVEIEENGRVIDDHELDFPDTSKGYSYNLMELVERTLVFGPMDVQSQQELTLISLLRSTGSSQYSSIEHPIHRFKLDPRFFDKYPALYDPNAESKFRPKNPPFIQKSQLPLPFTTESVKEYMNAALQARSLIVV
jgi:hypothetical protein